MGVFSIRGTSTVPLTLRVRHSLDPNSRIPWQLRYVGQPEMSQKSTVVRSCYDIACSSNVVEFLTELGCRCTQISCWGSSHKKTKLFGTIDPNVSGLGRVYPNFY